MKAIYKSFVFFLLLLIGIVVFFSQCKKETDCDAVITVKLQSDTSITVSNAYVKIYKGDILVSGYTDAGGQFKNTFKLEAILDIDASIKRGSDTLRGKTVIRLKPGEAVYKSVFIN